MAKFRKKPIEINAYQWFLNTPSEDIIILDKPIIVGDLTMVGKMKTLEDTNESFHYVCESDWIITGIKGEKYPCKNDIFLDTYDCIDDCPLVRFKGI